MATIRSINNLVKNKLWVLSYQLEEKKIATNAHVAKLRTSTREAIRRLQHDRR